MLEALMPIVGILVVGGVVCAVGAAIGAALGAGAVWFLHQWRARVRERQGAEVPNEEQVAAECGAVLAGSLLGGVLGCGAVVVVLLMVASAG